MGEEGPKNLKLIGIWMSEKKFQKLKWTDFYNVFRNHGFDIVKLDLERPLEEQGPLKVFIHKLTDFIVAADLGEVKAHEVIGNVEQYISNHPDMTVIDSLDGVRILLDRYRYYSLLERQPVLRRHGVFTPAFCMLKSSNAAENARQLRAHGVTFPLVRKSTLGHGSKASHRMAVVFNEAGLAACKPPCVVQSFVNHNAVLYKVFLVGNRYNVVERPSLKNFYACNERESIFFQSSDVCKADSQSTLSILDPEEISNGETKTSLDYEKIEAIIRVLRKELRLVLFGIDIVVDNATNQYAIIDINVYPGYEGFPNFFEHLVYSIDDLIACKKNGITSNGVSKINHDYINNLKVSEDAFDRYDLINVNAAPLIEDYFSKVIKNGEGADLVHV